MSPTKPYGGSNRKLVIAMDVGTTFSGIAYAILDPGEPPRINCVTRYPGQESGEAKIPTVLYYTQEGTVRAAGAEATRPGMELEAEDENLLFVEWFKLHLRPKTMDNSGIDQRNLPPLPPNKTVVDIFGDFLGYLFSCARTFITETHPNGNLLWSSVENDVEFVLSHPNGWEGLQQARMRQAAVMGGLIKDTTEDHDRVHFVTEGEASLHYCIGSGLATDVLKKDNSVMIVDAGGGTVDISTYAFTSIYPIVVEEIAPPDCILQGSTRVNVRAEEYLKDTLKNSRFGNEEDLKTMMFGFEKYAKPAFEDITKPSFVKFGSVRDNDPSAAIRRGQLTIQGANMAQFFDPCVNGIVDTIREQRLAAVKPVNMICLVGGFASSPWLFNQLQSKLKDMDCTVFRPDGRTNKAVAEGAVSYHLSHYASVSARVMGKTYGTSCCVPFFIFDPEHRARISTGHVGLDSSGEPVVDGAFSVLLAKGTRVAVDEEVSNPYVRTAKALESLNKMSADITVYRGQQKNPSWMDVDPESYSELCTVYADTSKVSKTEKRGAKGNVYYSQSFRVILFCGLTEIKAQIGWTEGGEEQRGPATVVCGVAEASAS